MASNLVTPPDIVDNQLHSVLLIEPEQQDLDAVIKFCQYSDQFFNIYVYTPNMDQTTWLDRVVAVSDTVIINTKSDNYKPFCLLEKTYYYGDTIYVENPRRIPDPLYYFASHFLTSDK